MNLNDVAKEINTNAKSKGFFDDVKNIGEMLCLIHSEVSEALEADRIQKYARVHDEVYDGSPDSTTVKYLDSQTDPIQWESIFKVEVKNTFEDELADVIIRVLDLCAFKNIDIEWHIKAKMKYNASRPHKHGGKAY